MKGVRSLSLLRKGVPSKRLELMCLESRQVEIFGISIRLVGWRLRSTESSHSSAKTVLVGQV
ncbi:hypothetical protein AG1IA_05016 [Rhizoctonia solani AG-1 IA]|uniref:Uncharacterized protein n=1 Tax=Thanatephorus cucumeris (strain AG1-IA) TaxID=983506 RepID=L8WS48_THACA|nr:hypothetical protein AG1IA_05016 [Rhizoctonia solani AG-1 IA]